MISTRTWRNLWMVAVVVALAVAGGGLVGALRNVAATSTAADTSTKMASGTPTPVAPPATTGDPAPSTTRGSTTPAAPGTTAPAQPGSITSKGGVTTVTPAAGPLVTGRVVDGSVLVGKIKGILLPFPAAPGLFNLQASAKAVTVSWGDGATSTSEPETGFTVYKRNSSAAWVPVATIAKNADPSKYHYTWTDTSTTISAQCYMVGSDGAAGSAFTVEGCTVRPDASAFPQSEPSTVKQWSGLSSVDDGLGTLANTSLEYNITNEHQTFGVSLGWDENAANNVKLERQGSGPEPLMFGEAVAIRVWGAGWLKYGNQTFGLDLQLSDTAAYEWYVVGDAAPGTPVGNVYALWNKATGDYLIHGDQTWGVSLDWYKKTQPSTTSTTTTNTNGVKAFQIYNCADDHNPLEIWVQDLTTGSAPVDKGTEQSQWSGSDCPAGGAPFVVTPVNGHAYVVETIDAAAPGCTNDPTRGDCTASTTTFNGNANGQIVSTTVEGD